MTWKQDAEFGEFAVFSVNRHLSAVLLNYDVKTHGKTKARSLARRLGGEEWLEKFLPDIFWNPGSIVTHPDLDAIAVTTGRNRDRRLIVLVSASCVRLFTA